MMNFPVPFAGIRIVVGPLERADLLDFLGFLGRGCDTPDPEHPEREHGHHIAVEFGENRVWGSELLGECAQRWHDLRRQAVAPQDGEVVPPGA